MTKSSQGGSVQLFYSLNCFPVFKRISLGITWKREQSWRSVVFHRTRIQTVPQPAPTAMSWQTSQASSPCWWEYTSHLSQVSSCTGPQKVLMYYYGSVRSISGAFGWLFWFLWSPSVLFWNHATFDHIFTAHVPSRGVHAVRKTQNNRQTQLGAQEVNPWAANKLHISLILEMNSPDSHNSSYLNNADYSMFIWHIYFRLILSFSGLIFASFGCKISTCSPRRYHGGLQPFRRLAWRPEVHPYRHDCGYYHHIYSVYPELGTGL